MARTLGLALCPWGALGGGRYKTEEQIAELQKRNEKGRQPFQPPSDGGEADSRITKVLDKIAKSKGPDIGVTGIALAYVMHKAPDVYPIVGGRKIDHLKQNIAALNVRLTDDEIKEIEDAGHDFKMGFPHNLLGGGEHGAVHSGDVVLLNRSGHYDFHPPKKVRPVIVGADCSLFFHLTSRSSLGFEKLLITLVVQDQNEYILFEHAVSEISCLIRKSKP